MDDDPFIRSDVDGRSASVIQIEQGKSVSVIALVLASVACALSVGMYVASRNSLDDMRALIDSKAQSAAAPASVRSQIAEREARVAQDQIQLLKTELETYKGAKR